MTSMVIREKKKNQPDIRKVPLKKELNHSHEPLDVGLATLPELWLYYFIKRDSIIYSQQTQNKNVK